LDFTAIGKKTREAISLKAGHIDKISDDEIESFKPKVSLS